MRVNLKKWLRKVFISILVLISLGAAGFIGWASFPSQAQEEALLALQSDSSVKIESYSFGAVFTPTSGKVGTGLILYPGGHVDWRSYSLTANDIASKGFLVIIAKMPFNLAVFAPNSAGDIITAYPQIGIWAVGGHSLGGVMAAEFAATHPESVNGLILWASYPAESNDLSQSSLAVLSISASQDGLTTPNKIDHSRALLPANTRWAIIQGGNHAQFGAYGDQQGDGVALISAIEQRNQIVELTCGFLATLSILR